MGAGMVVDNFKTIIIVYPLNDFVRSSAKYKRMHMCY